MIKIRVVGCLMGAIAGHIGGAVVSFLMGTMEILQSIPGMLLALALAAALGANFINIVLAISIASMSSYIMIIILPTSNYNR